MNPRYVEKITESSSIWNHHHQDLHRQNLHHQDLHRQNLHHQDLHHIPVFFSINIRRYSSLVCYEQG